MVLFLQLYGENLRAEVDIDILSGDTRQYQTGTWRLVKNDARNKRVEVVNIDVERYTRT